MTRAEPHSHEVDILARLKEPDVLQDPYPFYAWIREHAPVHANPTGGVYLVSRNADARYIYQSPDFRGVETSELAAKHPRWESSAALRILSRSITNTNPPAHTRLRRVMSRHFTLRQTQLLEAAARRHCDRLLTEVVSRLKDGETVDLHDRLTHLVGMNMAGDIIGVPETDRFALTELIMQVLTSLRPDAGDETLRAGNQATERVQEYFVQLVGERRLSPTEDLISTLLRDVHHGAGEPDQGLTWDEFVIMLWGLWTGGFETTVTAMDSGILAMLDYPDAATWLDDGPESVKAFVSETLRHSPPVLMDAIPRIAGNPLRLSGVTIPEGTDVRNLHGAANRDPDVFPDPDRFDPARNTSRMVTLGHGIHHCLGANLARMECAVVLAEVRKALPGLSLAERPVFRTSMSLRTLERFPVALDSHS